MLLLAGLAIFLGGRLQAAPGAFTLTSATASCSGSSPQITLNWTASSGVTTYDVYRNGSLYSPGVPAGTLTFLNTGANVTLGATYTYFIQAKNATGNTNSNSLQATAPSTCGTPTAYTLSLASSNPNSGVYIYVGPNDNQGLADGTTPFSRQFNSGTSVTLIAPTIAGGNNFVKWTRNGADYDVNRTTAVTMSAAYTMTAVFVAAPPVTHTITVASSNPSSGVNISSSTLDNNTNAGGTTPFTRVFNQNATAIYVAPATAGGNTFQKWQRDSSDLTTSTTASITLDTNHTITAVYATPTPTAYTLSLASSNPNSGVYIYVGPNDNQGLADGTTPFSRQFNSGTSVTLISPTTAGGNNFVKWTRNGADYDVNRTTAVTMSAAYTMTAVFVAAPPVTHTITVASSNPSSGVNISSSTLDNNTNAGGTTPFTRVFNQNATATYIAPVTAGGNSFQKWQRDGSDLTTSTTASITLDTDHTITAVYGTPTATIPGAPTSLSAFGGNGQIGLGWDAPSPNGGAAITSYRVFRGTNSSNTLIVTSGGCANLGVALGCTDTGLTNGQSYYYIVSAVNSIGQGPPSNSATATPATSALSIATTSPVPATATVGTGYAAQQAMAASGGRTPYSWSVSGLPSGMAINSSSGAIFGTPTVSGTFSFTVTVRDSSSPQQTASKLLSIAVGGGTPALSITTTSPVPATATVGTPYAAQQAVAAIGGQTPYNWSASGLPNGMGITSSSGAIFGTPTALGTFSFTVTVRDSSSPQQTASKAVSITVTQVLPPPTQPPPASTGLGATGTTTNRTVSVAEPVNTATGNYYNSLVDLTVPGRGLSFILTRNYNSQDSYSGPMGVGWTHSYNVYLTINPTSGLVAIKQGDGHLEYYTPVGGGGYAPQTLGLFNTLEQNADGSFTLTFKNQNQFHFSVTGTLLTIADRNGNTQTLNYDASGRLTSVIDPSGRVFNLAYDGNGRVISLSDPLGRTLGYAYDSSGDLASFTDAMGLVTQYSYDASSRLNSATDARGNVYMQNVYDSAGRVIQQTNARGFLTTFAYNTPSAGITSVTDPLGATTQYVYDSALRLSSVIAPDGAATSYAYDGNNLEMSWTDALGHTTNYAYDANGNVISSKDAGGHTTTSLYDGRNNLLKTTDALSRQRVFTYDGKGNLLTVQDAAGGITTESYNASGLLLSIQNARGFSTSYQYDVYGNRTQVTDALSGTTQMTYDMVGHLLATKNALGKTWTRTYDADNRLLTSTDPLGNTTSYAYDCNGNRTQVTDANGKVTAYAYDANNNLAQVTDAANGVTTYTYNGNDDRIGITDANGHTTTQAYDSLRRLQSRTDPLSRVQTYGYDEVGNRTSTIDGNLKTNSFTYDVLNRRVGASLSDGKTLSYTYDAAGNRLTMVDWRGTTAYAYDALNRVTSVTQPGNSVVSYAYDAVGNRTSITYPDGKAVHYQYDALNRLTQTTDWSSQTTTSGYDAAGNVVTTAYPNGTSTAHAYDDAGRLVNVTNRLGAQVNSAYTYVLDKVGNRMEVASYNEGVQRYRYDLLYRLTSWTSPSRQMVRYGYDAVGNRLSTAAPTGTADYTYDVADELLTASGTAFAYDGNGNQVSKTTSGTTLAYGWDALNRLTSVTGGGVNTQYQYDGDGNRVSQQTSVGTYGYVNDTEAPLPVVVNENGPDGSISYAYGASLISASATGLQSFYQFDGLGSVATVTDGTASQKASYIYEPWGSVIGGADLLASKNKFRFTGEAVDPGTGLVFLRARYYDPALGRFLSPDPIGSPNRSAYTYADNAPSSRIDPSGLTAVDRGNAQSGGSATLADWLQRVSGLGDLSTASLDLLKSGSFKLDAFGLIGTGAATFDEFHNTNDPLYVKVGVTSVNILLGVIPGLNLANSLAEIAVPQQRDAVVRGAVVKVLGGAGNILGTVGSALGSIYPSSVDKWLAVQSWLNWVD